MNQLDAQNEKGFATIPLKGLEADNLLAFLTLIGLLRALECGKPDWKPRIGWNGTPLSASLYLAPAVATDDVIRQVDSAIRALSCGYVFNKDDLKYTSAEFRELAYQALRDHEKIQLIAALASDGTLKRNAKDNELEVTPLCAIFGQGHQHFLSRLTGAVTRNESKNDSDLARALFEPWRYDDDTPGFRWDPIEDRRYAHQFGNPSEGKNKIGTVTGANRLAAIGFAMLTSAPTAAGLATIAVFGVRREQYVCWPLVGVPTGLKGYAALLAHPWLGNMETAPALAAYGVAAIARARRYQVDKFFNFERARLQFL